MNHLPVSLSYLLAVDLFALTALAMAAAAAPTTSPRLRRRLLWAMFGLSLVRSLSLLLFLRLPDLYTRWGGSLEILSVVLVGWALVQRSVFFSPFWRLYAWTAGAMGALFVAIAAWQPHLPWQRLAILAGLGGLPLAWSWRTPWRQSRPIALLGITAGLFLGWRGLASAGEFVALLGYGALLHAVFVETSIAAHIQRQNVESLGAETHRIRAEQQQLTAIIAHLNTAPSPGDLLDHAVRLLPAHLHAEQVAILSFVQMAAGAGCVAAVASTDDTIHFTSRDTKPFPLADIPPLLDVLERQQAIHLSPEREAESLRPLYALWGESRLGPAFLHPLFQGEKVIGVLVMGNPVSGFPLEPSGLRLARGIAAYLAGVVLFQQHYHMLEMQTEEIAVHLQTFSIEQDKYASIIEAIGDGVVVSNRKGKIYLMNNAAERLLGKSRQELVGQNFSTLYPLIAGGGLTEKSLLNLNRSNEPLSTFFERDDLAVQGQVIPLRNSRQEWMGVLLLLRDVTDRRTADRAKTDFIETISRELRTPLTTAGGYVDLMLGGATGKLNINQQYFLQVVKKGLERANELIANATHLMDMPTGDLRLEMETVPAGDLLKEASRTARPLIVRRKLHFAAELEPELPPIRADRVQLRQALERLLDNACRVTPEGGRVSLRAWTQTEGLNGQQSRYLIVSVSDEGGGLSPKEQKLIFEPVARSTGSVSQRVKERGRDLSPVRAIIEAHGGRIWVESAEGKGSVFHVALPAAEA